MQGRMACQIAHTLKATVRYTDGCRSIYTTASATYPIPQPQCTNVATLAPSSLTVASHIARSVQAELEKESKAQEASKDVELAPQVSTLLLQSRPSIEECWKN